MYIHLSTDTAVLKRSILAVINLEEVSPQNRMVTDYINSEDDRGRLQYTSEEVPKSVIVTDEGTYVSSLSVNVLQRRLSGEVFD